MYVGVVYAVCLFVCCLRFCRYDVLNMIPTTKDKNNEMLILRGMFAYEVLVHVLRKRCNVDYGLRKGGTGESYETHSQHTHIHQHAVPTCRHARAPNTMHMRTNPPFKYTNMFLLKIIVNSNDGTNSRSDKG